MPTIADIKQQYPDLGALDDDQVVDALHQAFYADMPREQVAQSLGVKPPPPPKSSTASRVASDLYKSVKSGILQLPGQITGLEDIPAALLTGRRPISDAADWVGEKTGFQPGKWAKEIQYSPEAQQSQQEIENTWKDPNSNALDVAGAYLKNPAYSANQVAQSLPAMIAGGVLSRSLMTAGRAAPVLENRAANIAAKAGTPGYLERAIGDKWAASVAGGIGEGLPQAGQQMDQYNGDDQRKNAIAAVGSGAIDAAIGAGAGRIAQALGLETAETAMAKGFDARKVETPLSAPRRIAGGMASESVLQELPQSIQEQNWQNWAEGKSLMEGALRQGVEGAIAGGVMGAGANIRSGTVEGHSPADMPLPAPPAAAPLQLGNTTDPYLSFADGTVARKSEIVAYINSLPPDLQPAARAKVMGLAPQPATPAQAMGIDPAAGPLSSAAAIAVNTGTTQEIQRNQASEADQVAYDEAAALQEQQAVQQAQQQDSAVNPITTGPIAEAAMSPEDKRAILFSNQPVTDGGMRYTGTQDGDILNGLGKPYATRMAAQRRVQMEGKDWMVAPVFDGFVARRKDAPNGTTDATASVDQGADAGAGHQPTGSGTNSLAEPVPGTDGAGSLPAASDGRSESDHAVVDAGDGGAAVAQAGASHVQDPTPAAQLAPAQAMGTTTPAVASDATVTEGLPGAAGAAVEAAGVDPTQVSQPAATAAQPQESTHGNTPQNPKQAEQVPNAHENADAQALSELVAPNSQPQGSTNGPTPTQAVQAKEKGPQAPAAGEQVAPEFIKVKDIDGRNRYVRQSDLDGDKPLIRMFTKDGKNNGRIHRENLDPTGEKQAANNAENASNPFFDVITNKDGGAFATVVAARRALNQRGLQSTHIVAKASDVSAGATGFVVRKKAPQSTTEVDSKPEAAQVAPKRGIVAKIAQAQQARADYFTPGNIVKGYSGHDEVLRYTPSKGDGNGWSVKVRSVIKQDGKWVPDPKDNRDRVHSTQPDARELKAGPVERIWNKVADQVQTEPKEPTKESLFSRVPVPADNTGKLSSFATPANEAGQQGTVDSSQSEDQSIDEPVKNVKSEPKPAQVSAQPAAEQGTALFSRSTDIVHSGGQPADRVQALVDAIAGRWKNAPRTVVVQSLDDPRVPEKVRGEGKLLKSNDSAGSPDGFFDKGTGTVYLIADKMPGDIDVVRVLMHESLGHYGLRGQYGAELGTILDRIAVLNSAKVKNAAKRLGLDFEKPSERRLATEEVLAYMAQETPELGWVKRTVAAVRAWLRQHIPSFSKMQLSDEELIRDYIIPARQFVEDGSRKNGEGVTSDTETPFSRAATKPESAALEQLSQNDELFALPKSDKTTVEGIAADTDPGITVKKLNHPGLVQTYMLTMPDGGKARMMVRAVNPYGPQAYGMLASEDGETNKAMTDRPGLNAERVPDDVESVYIDVSALKGGSYGVKVYNIASTYAHNTGRILIGDPAGLSDIAMRRRTENMLSSALKFGTTRHLAPHPRQIDGAYGIGVPPLHWTYGDDLGNIKSLIETSLKSLKNAGENLLTFDLQTGTFRDSAGRVLDDSAIRQIVGEGRRPESYAGITTYKRSAVLSALVREEGAESGAGGQGAGILAQLVDVGRQFPASSKGILYSRNLGDSLTSAANNVRDVNLPAGYKVSDLINGAPGKLNWWHKSVGTQYNLAQRSAPFKKVYDSVQNFINDVSYYATEAADLAPTILPKLETLKDIGKSPLSAEDTKAVSAPIFEGTLTWGRDESGQPVKMDALEHNAANLTTEKKGNRLLRNNHISEGVLKMWQGLDINQYETLINNKYEHDMLKPGVVWTPAELKSIFKLNDKQVGLYQEFRKATDKSLTNLAIADMLRFGGDDVIPLREAALDSETPAEAATMLADYLRTLTDLNPQRKEVLLDTADKMIEKGDKAAELIDRGYAPLSRFGQYTLDVVHNGERVYFGMFENKWEAAKMNRKMYGLFPGAMINQGTVSEQAYKMFAGVSPETLELFGDMLGLEGSGDGAANAAFQTYLKLARSNRSAMKRLIQRKGIAGFSEDAGRVLAGFVYSNARQTASSLHMGDMTRAAADKEAFGHNGELQDAATKLVEYIKNPQEEAQAFRGLMFAQYIGGSVASAMVNLTQPLTMTFPWLAQYGTVAGAAKQMLSATKDANKKKTGDAALDSALHKAEEDGTVSPQEVHQLMQQAMGRGVLRSGDGTTAGNAMATAQNTLSRVGLAWGKMFSTAEQFNRRVTFIAAYRTAVQAKMADPDAFARQAIAETQGVYNRGNKPQWARGALGSTLFTFKQYSISYVEMLSRMAKNGPQGRKAALLALAVMFVLSGASGLPGSDDLDDIISGALQAMGYNFDSKQKRKEFFVSLIGEGGADFMERGISGLPGVPVDVSGRLGIGNLIPGTGLLTKKTDHTRDVAEFAGVAGDFLTRGFDTASKIIKGDIGGVHGAVATMAPKAAQNLFQAYDMANTGMYRDAQGRKVLDTDAVDALSKAVGLQPNDVKRVQDAAGDAMRMIGLNRIRESEIAGEWAAGLFEKDQAKVQAARDDLKQWNIDNPDSPIKINFRQILQRVHKMNESKIERIAKTSPKEIRASVKRELLASQ